MLQSFSRTLVRCRLNGYCRFSHHYRYKRILGGILQDKTFLEKCRNAGLTNSMIYDGFKHFKKDIVFCHEGTEIETLKVQYILEKIAKYEVDYSSIFPFFLNYAKKKNPAVTNRTDIHRICDLTNPARWYPNARSLKRSIVFHAGPTNSGKTHSALEKFLSSERGIYCSPLRLLAREISEKSRSLNIPCSLITGEEKNLIGDCSHVSCTVEMVNLRDEYDVGVIDEIQVIADEERGWAWTQALLGLNAKEIHVCGEPRAISIVKKLCRECGDDFEVNHYERLTKLRVKKKAVGSIDQLRSGDCVVCFRRKDIYDTVSHLKKCGREVAVVYGKLPPLTKKTEALKFNNPKNSCDILVATDAVGMGLNLNIKRIVFQALNKGVKNNMGIIENTQLTTPQALQIAGRAGRYGLQESGEVTTLYDHDINTLHRLLLNSEKEIRYARILPTKHHYLKFSSQVPSASLFSILSDFRRSCQINKQIYLLSSQRDCLALAKSFQKLKLSVSDAYTFSLCPINCDSEMSRAMFVKFVKEYSCSRPVKYNLILKFLKERFSVKFPILAEIEYSKIAVLEDIYNVLSAYLWLFQKFPKYFPDNRLVMELQKRTASAVTESLHNVRY